MKNVIVFLLSVVILIGFAFLKEDSLSFYGASKVVLVTENCVSDEYVKSGEDFYCTFYDDEWEEYEGESSCVIFYFEEFNMNDFFQKCDFVYSCLDIDGEEVYEGFYKGYDKSVTVAGRKVNFQFAVKGDGGILGFPLIVVGF